MPDITLSGSAVAVITALMVALSGAIGVLFKALTAAQAARYDAVVALQEKAFVQQSFALATALTEKQSAEKKADESRQRAESWEQKAFEIAERTARVTRSMDVVSEKLAAQDHPSPSS